MPFVKVAKASGLRPGEAVKVDVGEQEIMVANVGGTFYAVQEKCTHRGGPLHMGVFKDGVVICPWHKTEFDLRTGRVLKIPFPPRAGTAVDLKTFEVKVEGEDVLVNA